MESYFHERSRESAKFLQRFASIRFVGKQVLDFGSGLGNAAFLVAKLGASKVVGVEIDRERVAFARRKLAAQYPELGRTVEFVFPEEIANKQFDIIISEDCFEHYHEPEKIMTEVRRLLTPSGYLMIGFGPLWKSPWGGHIGYMTRLPWAHLIFSESVIMAERRRYRPGEDAQTFAQMRGGLNRMTYAKFHEVMATTGYEVLNVRVNVSKNLIMRLFRLLRLIPLMNELFTVNVYAIARPKDGVSLTGFSHQPA
jgi:SAM-dependent methyltransferase